MNRTKRELNLFFLTKITDNDSDLLRFCHEMQLIPCGVKCPTCSQIMREPYMLRRKDSDYDEVRFVCGKKKMQGALQKELSINKIIHLVLQIKDDY